MKQVGRKLLSEPLKTYRFVCMKCRSHSPKSQFETVDKLLDHVRTSHPKAFWPCSQCKLLKYNSASLKIHSRICKMKLTGRDFYVKVKKEEPDGEWEERKMQGKGDYNLIDFVPPVIRKKKTKKELDEDRQLSACALRMRRQRKNEPHEQKRARLDKDNASRRLKRQMERAEDKEKRLAEQRRQYKTKWKHMTDDQLAEEVKGILLEKRDKWGHNVTWNETLGGKLLMTRKELENVKETYERFMHKKRKEA